MIKCKICNKEAKYKEFSPDGETDYFCSKIHHSKYVIQQHKKGVVWRASPLEKLQKL